MQIRKSWLLITSYYLWIFWHNMSWNLYLEYLLIDKVGQWFHQLIWSVNCTFSFCHWPTYYLKTCVMFDISSKEYQIHNTCRKSHVTILITTLFSWGILNVSFQLLSCQLFDKCFEFRIVDLHMFQTLSIEGGKRFY